MSCRPVRLPDMNLSAVLKRIERRLEALEISADAASKAAGKPDAIRNIRRAVKNGQRQGVNMTTLDALASALKTTPQWLHDGVGPEDPSAGERTIPVWGRAGAGGAVYNFHEATELGRIPVPRDSGERTGAVEINGASLGRIFDGWYAVYDERRDPPTLDLVGQLCIVGLADGRVLIKQLAKGRGKRFTLESNYEAPIYDVVVEWAAPVKTMVPK